MTSNTTTIDRSDLCLETKQACGYVDNDSKTNIAATICSMIQKRIIGPNGFTNGQKCRINNYFLPDEISDMKYVEKACCGSYSKDGRYLLTATRDRFLELYHARNGHHVRIKEIQAPDIATSVLDTAFSPDNSYIAYSSKSQYLYMCAINDDPSLQDVLCLYPNDGEICVSSLVFSNDGNEIINSASDGHLYVYDLKKRLRSLRINAHSKEANAVTFADNTSQILITGGDDNLCKVWDRRALHESNPKPVGIFAGHKGGITYIDARGDGRHLITNSKDETIKLWDMRAFSDGEAVRNTGLAVDDQPSDNRSQPVPALVACMSDTKNLEGDTSIMTYRGHRVVDTLMRCHFSPVATTGQRYIYTGCADGNVIIYDVLTGEIASTLHVQKLCVRDVSWHPYYPQIVSTSTYALTEMIRAPDLGALKNNLIVWLAMSGNAEKWKGAIVTWKYGTKYFGENYDYDDYEYDDDDDDFDEEVLVSLGILW